jgi:hypothetical protein
MRNQTLAILAAILIHAPCVFAAQEDAPTSGTARSAPFMMPPPGKGKALVGHLDYTAPSALAFDQRNRPYLLNTRDADTAGVIITLRRGQWVRRPFAEAVRDAVPGFAGFLATPERPHDHALGTMVIDGEDHLYVVTPIREGQRRRPVLIHSSDLGEHFQVYDLPGDPDQAFLETRVGHNDLSRPPLVGMLKFRAPHPARWTAYYVLSVTAPEMQDGRLAWRPPVTISRDCFGVSNHSGGYSFAVTLGERAYLVYAEIPKEGATGNPAFAATVDRAKLTRAAAQPLCTAPPKTPDVHSTPVIAADSRGHLHAVAGAHGQPFLYLRSKQPGRVDGGWTDPQPIGRRQTYAALVCDGQDRLHLVFREWKNGVATLSYQSKMAGEDAWPPSSELAVAPGRQRGYGIFYHRLFVDREDALYVSFSFLTMQANDFPRALAVSEDGGSTWRLAARQDFLRRTRPQAGKAE